MKWTVVWHPKALEDLADIWRRSHRKQLISNACDEIDARLINNPRQHGKLQRNKLVLHVSPISISFEILEDDRLVRVVQVAEETN